MENLKGKRFGLMTVVGQTSNKKNQRNWIVLCDCGNICEKTTSLLKNTISCGCFKKKILSNRKKINKDEKFGFLTTVKICRKSYWECLCFCGKIVEVRSQYLLSGKTKSCGCMSIHLRNDSYYKNRPVKISLKKLEYLRDKYYPELNIEDVRKKIEEIKKP